MIRFTTGTGRIVMGSLTIPQLKDKTGRVLDKPRYFIGVALPKSDPLTNEFIEHIVTEAATAGAHPGRDAGIEAMRKGIYPGHPEFPARQYAWKFEDGDVNPSREGFAGNFIFKFQQNFPSIIKNWDGTAEITDPTQMRTGFWARIVVDIKFNGSTEENAGAYLSPATVGIQREDAEISGVDAVSAFAGGTAPTGAAAHFGVAPNSLSSATTPPATTPPATTPKFTPPKFVPPTVGEVTYEMTAAAQGASREDWEKAGYTVERLLKEGIMIAKNDGAVNP